MSFIVPANFRQLPQVWEIDQPFRIDATGAVSSSPDPVRWATNHILALLLTSPGERVMRPQYGIGMYRMVFENDDAVVEQMLITAINQGLAMWEPNVRIVECEFVQQPDFSGIMELQIGFTVGAAPTINTVAFSVGGTGVEVQAT